MAQKQNKIIKNPKQISKKILQKFFELLKFSIPKMALRNFQKLNLHKKKNWDNTGTKFWKYFEIRIMTEILKLKLKPTRMQSSSPIKCVQNNKRLKEFWFNLAPPTSYERNLQTKYRSFAQTFNYGRNCSLPLVTTRLW